MRFTLTYDGPLLSRGSAQHKEDIRQALHPQLAELWTHEPLEGADLLRPTTADGRAEGELSVLTEVGEQHVFAPLVCDRLALRANIDILMLRPELPGGIVTSGGDIDNRLKTLFDALSVPTQEQDMALGAASSTADDPVYTLLEDDRLITRVSVDTERLLAEPSPEHVRLIIRVSLTATKLIWANMSLVS